MINVDLILLVFFSYRNGMLAKLKGLNALVWGLVTSGAWFAGLMVGFFLIIFGFRKYAVDFNLLSSTNAAVREGVAHQLVQSISSNTLDMVTIELIGFGGYLLVRNFLERRPGKKEPEVHWMDKLGRGE